MRLASANDWQCQAEVRRCSANVQRESATDTYAGHGPGQQHNSHQRKTRVVEHKGLFNISGGFCCLLLWHDAFIVFYRTEWLLNACRTAVWRFPGCLTRVRFVGFE